MELAANMVADPDKLTASPVMFLFSGAEEPLCQVATLATDCLWSTVLGPDLTCHYCAAGICQDSHLMYVTKLCSGMLWMNHAGNV